MLLKNPSKSRQFTPITHFTTKVLFQTNVLHISEMIIVSVKRGRGRSIFSLFSDTKICPWTQKLLLNLGLSPETKEPLSPPPPLPSRSAPPPPPTNPGLRRAIKKLSGRERRKKEGGGREGKRLLKDELDANDVQGGGD